MDPKLGIIMWVGREVEVRCTLPPTHPPHRLRNTKWPSTHPGRVLLTAF